MPRHDPRDCLALLSSRELVEFACDVARNPAFSQASATTRDAHGFRVADYVADRAARQRWPERILERLARPLPDFERFMAREPVRLSRIPKDDGGTREVAVPSFARRCISHVFNEILVGTSDHLLPRCVRAYRPGRERAVQDAILDVASAVHNGRVRYFAQLDIKSYFSEMPWQSIEQALRHFGYCEEFIRRLMVVVNCPMLRRERGRVVRLSASRGAQQGLAESAALGNLLPWELDRDLESRGRLMYIRYADDLFVGASDRAEVVAAARSIAAWCGKHDLRLKGVDRNARIAGLVRDIKKAKIDLLGAEIDALGYVHMPAKKLRKKAAELDHMHAHLAVGDVYGVSRFGDGGGVDTFDEQDLQRSMTAFIDYWVLLDPRGAERARQVFRKRFPLTAASSDAARGTAWVARLWGNQANREGGTTPTVHHPMLLSSEESSSEPHRRSPSATGEADGAALSLDPSSPSGSKDSDDAAEEPGPTTSAPPVAQSTRSVEEAAHVDSLTCMETPSSSLELGTSDRGDEDALPPDADGFGTYRFITRSLETESSWLRDLDEDHLAPELHQDEGALGDPTNGASPPWSVLENTIFIHAVHARVGRDRVVLVGTCQVAESGRSSRVAVRVARERRTEPALVRELLDELSSTRDHRVVFGVEQTWLPKGLLQRHRRFRAPLLFGLLLELHQAARGREVLLVGGMELPAALRRAMGRTLDDLIRTAA